MTNTLFQGDNLTILRNMPDESVDLICTDPPFNTGKDWGAFSDKWEGGLKGYLKFMEAACRGMQAGSEKIRVQLLLTATQRAMHI